MKMTTERWLAEYKWRHDNKIKGKCYYFNTLVPPDKKNYAEIPGVLRPSGMCLYTNKKYFIQECPMGWDIQYITDNEEKFNEITKNAWGGEKGLFRNVSCWDVLTEMQRDGGQDYALDVYPLYHYVSLKDLMGK